jgi:hypothetical protein
MAGDNATVDALARRCREDLIACGEVEREGVRIANGRAGVGDEIVTLKNDRKLRWAPGEFVRNGERWRVVERDLSGALTVEGLARRGRVTLPPQYVAEHVALGYALTVTDATQSWFWVSYWSSTASGRTSIGVHSQPGEDAAVLVAEPRCRRMNVLCLVK